MPSSRRSAVLIGVLLVATFFLGCRTTRPTRSVEPSGFLGDYSQLEEGSWGEAQLVYINEGTDFSTYDSIWLESVEFWASEETAKVPKEDRQALTDKLYTVLRDEFSKDYKLALEPGPGVMRVRAAITDAKGSMVVLNTVTTAIPQTRAASTLLGLATDTALFVGRAGIEVELADSVTGERLAAAVDQRAGTKTLRGGLREWSHVHRSFEHWGERFHERLAELRETTARSQ